MQTFILHTKAYLIVHTAFILQTKAYLIVYTNIHFAHQSILHSTYKHTFCTPKHIIWHSWNIHFAHQRMSSMMISVQILQCRFGSMKYGCHRQSRGKVEYSIQASKSKLAFKHQSQRWYSWFKVKQIVWKWDHQSFERRGSCRKRMAWLLIVWGGKSIGCHVLANKWTVVRRDM